MLCFFEPCVILGIDGLHFRIAGGACLLLKLAEACRGVAFGYLSCLLVGGRLEGEGPLFDVFDNAWVCFEGGGLLEVTIRIAWLRALVLVASMNLRTSFRNSLFVELIMLVLAASAWMLQVRSCACQSSASTLPWHVVSCCCHCSLEMVVWQI